MNRYLILSIALLIAVGAWFARPGSSAPAAGEPLVVEASPAEAMGLIHAASLEDAFKQTAVAGQFDAFAAKLTLKHDESGPRHEVVSLWRATEKILVIKIDAKPDGSGTALDISAQVPSSSMTHQRVLKSSDRSTLAIAADLVVTDYLASLLQNRPASSSDAMALALQAQAGFSNAERTEFANRVSEAVAAAFGGQSDMAASSEDASLDADTAFDSEESDDSGVGSEPDPDFGQPSDPVPEDSGAPDNSE